MKIAAITQRPFVKNIKISNSTERCHEVQNKPDVMSYFDIPFAASFKHEINVPTDSEIQNGVLESQRSKNEVLNQAQHVFDVCTKAKEFVGYSKDKLRASLSSGITKYTDNDGNIKREILKNRGDRPDTMREYESARLVRTTEFYQDGSLKINDKASNMTVFADSLGNVTSIEVTKGQKLSEVINLSDDRLKYVKFKTDKLAQRCADVFIYSKDYNESRTEVKYFKNVYGRDYSKPEKCDSITYLANDDLESKTPFYILVYYSDVQKSLSKESYAAKNAVFYTFDGLLPNSSGVVGRIVAQEPISYNKHVKFSIDKKFPLSNNIESQFAMMNHNGEYSELPL